MNNFDKDFTLSELEELRRLYLDCKLTVSDEVELEYVLQQVPLRSPLVDEVRAVMSMSHDINLKPGIISVPRRRRRLGVIGAAASVVVLIATISIVSLTGKNRSQSDNQSVYIAYVAGKRVSDAKARIIAEAERANAKRLIKKLEDDKAKVKTEIEQIKQIIGNSK